MLKIGQVSQVLCALALLLCSTLDCVAADSVLTRQMAAEIVEQAATTNAAYATVLRDVGKALRSKEMSVADAKDLLSLAAACQQLGARHPGQAPGGMPSQPTYQPQPLQPQAIDTRPAPPQLDIDKLLDEEMASAGKKRESLFKGLDTAEEQAGGDAASGTTTSSSGAAYMGGTAGRQLPWNSDIALERAQKETSSEKERSPLSQASAQSVDASTLRKASSRVHGKVTMVRPGPDGQPQLALISIGAKNGLKDKQEVLFSRNGQALVKGVINRLKDHEAFALIIGDSWAASVEKEIKIGDTVSGL